jgi:hypothetical protein
VGIIFLKYFPASMFNSKGHNTEKQVILHLKCSVSSTVTKFEHCHYIRCGDTAQYSKVSLSAVSASDDIQTNQLLFVILERIHK